MTDPQTTAGAGGLDSPLVDALVGTRRFFTKGTVSSDLRVLEKQGGRRADDFYRDRWSHDKVVRSTHGVNCTGSCSWKVYVKDGIITWEAQQTDYPSTGPDRPEYEPRGCPRGAAFSWYTYSPTRIRYPYVRGALLQMYREGKAQWGGDPVQAWAHVVDNPARAARYKSARGKGGLVRATWDEALEMVAAAYVHTIATWGPDRVAGFSPIPAMSMVSHASGARFTQLVGGAMLSFYDWYADLPVASPQVFGDQTDVPESGDWWDAGYLVMWGSNVPVTRTPDAHWMAEARYRGQKVIAVAPDYADNVKFADEWLPARPGTDAALALAMGQVILDEFFVKRTTPYFDDYVKKYTDLPFLVKLEDGRAGKLLTAGDLPEHAEEENAAFRTVLLDGRTGETVVPNGSLGHRFGDEGLGKWNLDLQGVEPVLALEGDPTVEVTLPLFDDVDGSPGQVTAQVPARRVGDHLVTTVYELMLARYATYTPEWQEPITGVPAHQAARIAREFARNAEESHGRSMILMGAGTNHWFHSDTIYRAFLALTTLTGCQGVNGGGWAHYVGQEKVRPVTGHAHLANALDWSRPPRNMIQAAYWYLHADQFRYDHFSADVLSAAISEGQLAGLTTADVVAKSARMGWMPSYPTFDRNPLDLCEEATAAGRPVAEHVVEELRGGRLGFAGEAPDDPRELPPGARGVARQPPRLLGEGQRVLPQAPARHRLGRACHRGSAGAAAPRGGVGPDGAGGQARPAADARLPPDQHDAVLRRRAPGRHLVREARPVHHRHAPVRALVQPGDLAAVADPHRLGRVPRDGREVLRAGRATAGRAQGRGRRAADPRHRRRDGQPARRRPRLAARRVRPGARTDDAAAGRGRAGLRRRQRRCSPRSVRCWTPSATTTKGVTYDVTEPIDYLRSKNGTVRSGVGAGRPALVRDVHFCEAILALSGTTNGHLAVQGFRQLEERTGTRLHDLAAEHEGKQITFADTQAAPTPVITSPEWSGSESGGRRYSPFTINVERLKPWHTLTGRQTFYLDHDWMSELGESLPVYRPPLNMAMLFGESRPGDLGELDGLTVRYLTPHNKWSIHSEYQDNLFMLSLSRGGQTIWMSDVDAAKVGVADNDWIEAVNRNGVVVARAIVSHRMPEGTVYMHHAQDRLINVPLSETSGRRGGIHNSLTRLLIKPSHLIGGYAQLTFAFNYLGPTGNQRDEVTVIRRRSQEVQY